MKILYVTTIGSTMDFFRSVIQLLISKGVEVDIATNTSQSDVPNFFRELGCRIFTISTSRFPLSKGNIASVKQLKKIAKDYDIVHCHTPVASACTRIACRRLHKKGLRVVYTAHGFHFYRGAPLKNWFVYFPIEKVCARWTDVIITINKEDYELAKEKLKAKHIEYVPGVGIDTDFFARTTVNRGKKRIELGVPQDAFLLLSVGELNENKNHEIVIKALAILRDDSIHYAIAGRGQLRTHLEQSAKALGVEKQVHFLGYRSDVAELYKTADINVFPSIREGLGLAALEGMASGLPLLCSDNRGSRSYAFDGKNCLVCGFNDAKSFATAILKLKNNNSLRLQLSDCALKTAVQYDISLVNRKMMKIYGLSESAKDCLA